MTAHAFSTHRKPVDGLASARPTVHMVGYSHLDPVWLWQWTEGYAEARATLQSAVDRLREYPEFVYATTSSIFFAWVEEADSELFAEAARFVRDGRIHLLGGWVVEPDCNIPSGESLARQGLYGQRMFAEQFGVRATVGANPDSFGHAATIPKLLRGAGMDGYVFVRPGRDEAVLPDGAFRWIADDGSDVVACRLPCYSSDRDDIGVHTRRCIEQFDADHHLVFYGVGNHGGAWTRRSLDALRRMHATSGRADLVCSTPRAFIDAVANDATAFEGELQHHARGCYSAHRRFKALHRRAENALQIAERWCTVARHVADLPYPADQLRAGWMQVLFNQFHDTLAGTAIEAAYDDATWQLGEALSIAQRTTNAAVQRLARRISIPHEEDMQPIVVFNAHPWPVRQVIEIEVGGWAKRRNLVDDTGASVPLQWGASEATMCEGRYRAVFPVDLPPLGHRVYRLRLGACELPDMQAANAYTLENAHLLISFDPRTGAIAHLVDKALGVDLAAHTTSPHAVVLVDDADTWGHDHDRWTDVAGVFAVEHVERIEHGPARTVMRVTSRCEMSTLVEDYALGHDDRWIDVSVTLDWRERQRMCKLRYATSIDDPTVTADIPFGSVQRPSDGCEEPMQQWVDVSNGAYGVTIANDGTYAYDARGGEVGITIARSVPYAHHAPARLVEGADYRYLDLGEHRLRLRLLPHAGACTPSEATRRAAELNMVPLAVRDTYHAGPSSMCASFVSVDATNIGAFTLKRSEDHDADIVRVVEYDGRASDAHVRLLYRRTDVPVDIVPHGVATVRVHDDAALVPVDLCEWTGDERPTGQPTPDGRPPLPDASC